MIVQAGLALTRPAPLLWRAAPYRCPCGFAIDDADEFDQHLGASEGADPEHFEVLAGWTLQQVRRWQAAAVPNRPGTASIAITKDMYGHLLRR
jgi:hypothetical protein